MSPEVDITRPFKKNLRKLMTNPEEYETPKEMLSEIQKYINRKVQAVYDVRLMTKKDLNEVYREIEKPEYAEQVMIVVRFKR